MKANENCIEIKKNTYLISSSTHPYSISHIIHHLVKLAGEKKKKKKKN